jgi:hypothetical protein
MPFLPTWNAIIYCSNILIPFISKSTPYSDSICRILILVVDRFDSQADVLNTYRTLLTLPLDSGTVCVAQLQKFLTKLLTAYTYPAYNISTRTAHKNPHIIRYSRSLITGCFTSVYIALVS